MSESTLRANFRLRHWNSNCEKDTESALVVALLDHEEDKQLLRRKMKEHCTHGWSQHRLRTKPGEVEGRPPREAPVQSRVDEEQPGGSSGTPVRPERPEVRAARK